MSDSVKRRKRFKQEKGVLISGAEFFTRCGDGVQCITGGVSLMTMEALAVCGGRNDN
jgi:hypothetical protein